jgi:hypothetical protein
MGHGRFEQRLGRVRHELDMLNKARRHRGWSSWDWERYRVLCQTEREILAGRSPAY